MKNEKPKDTMDEMQERNLLKIEEQGFWLLFWLLFAAVIIQVLIMPDLRTIIGEASVLLTAGTYISVSALKRGLWGRGLVPKRKTNAVASLIPALLLGFVYCVRKFIVAEQNLTPLSVISVSIRMIVIYAACFIVLEIVRAIYQKKRDKLDDIEEV